MDLLALQGIEPTEPKTPSNQIRDAANAGLFRDLMARLRQDDTGPAIAKTERNDTPAPRDNPSDRRTEGRRFEDKDHDTRTASADRRDRADEPRTDDTPKVRNEPADDGVRKADDSAGRTEDRKTDEDTGKTADTDEYASTDKDDDAPNGDAKANTDQDKDETQTDTDATVADNDAGDEEVVVALTLDDAGAPKSDDTVAGEELVVSAAVQGQAAQAAPVDKEQRIQALPAQAANQAVQATAAAAQKADADQGPSEDVETDASEPIGGAPKIIREANGGREPMTRISGANALQAQQQVSGETAGAVTQQQATSPAANTNATPQAPTNPQPSQSAQVTAVAATDDATSGGAQGGNAHQSMDQRDQRGGGEADKGLATLAKSNTGTGNDLGIAFARAQRPGETFEQTLNRVVTPTGAQAVRMDGSAATAVRGSDSVSASFGGPQSNPAVGKASTPVSQPGVRHGVQQHAVADQVSVRLKTAAQNGDSTVRIQLKPTDLGQVDVKLEIARDGQVRALVMAERPETLDALQRDSRQLERALQDAGLKTDSNSLEFDLKGRDGQNAQAFAKRDENGGQGKTGEQSPANDDQSGTGQDAKDSGDTAPGEDGALNMVA